MKRYPDFFIIGAGKSGTTALWEAMGSHPSIFMTNDIAHKELGYFCDYYGVKDEDEYLGYFKDARPDQLIGEVCHAYITSPESPRLIKAKCKSPKFIAILRNPVDRAYSLYNYMTMNGYEYAKNFETALALEPLRAADENFKKRNPQGFYMNYQYYGSGLYSQQLKRYISVFGRENLLIFIYEEAFKNESETLESIFQFLNLKTWPQIKIERSNESKSVFSIKSQFFFKSRLPWLLMDKGISEKWSRSISDFLLNLNYRRKKPPMMNPETRRLLYNRFRGEIEELSILLNKDLFELWKF